MASHDGPQTEAGELRMRRAMTFNVARHRAIPWGVKPGNEHDQPPWSGYFGDRPYPQAKLISSVWDRALGIGIACPGRWIGLDTDIKNGKVGREHMIQLEAELGPLPSGPITFTKSGGDHRIFKRAVIPANAVLRSHVGLADGTDSDSDVIHSRYRRFKPPLRDDHGSRASLCSGPSSVGDVAVAPEEVLSPATRVMAA